MHLTAHDATTPGAAFGSGGVGWGRMPGQARWQLQLGQGAVVVALDGDAEQHEIDVGIDRWAWLPDALEDEGAQRVRVQSMGVERLDGGQMGLMAEALTERQLAFGGVATILPQVRNEAGQWVIERDVAARYEVQDRGCGEQDLGQ